MEVKSQPEQSVKAFGHSVIHWTIRNYCSVHLSENHPIESPQFSAKGTEETQWCLKLIPNHKIGESHFVLFFIKRMGPEINPDIVCANWKVTLRTYEHEILSETNQQYFFKINWSHTVKLISVKDVLGKLHPLHPDHLHIECQLIISSKKINEIFEKPSDICLRCLSRDLNSTYRRGQYSDLTLVIGNLGDKYIKAHRAILGSRSRYYKRLFNPANEEEGIRIEKLNCEAVDKAIAYLYSGNLQFVLGKPTVSIYECIRNFQIDEVKPYFNMDELFWQTNLVMDEINYTWVIADFITRNEDFLLSPVFKSDLFNQTWRLRVYPKGYRGNTESVSIFAEVIEGRKSQGIILEFCVLDRNKEFRFPKRIMMSTEHANRFGFVSFIERSKLDDPCILVDGGLRIYIKVRVDKSEISSTTSHMDTIATLREKKHPYNLLSNDMDYLLTSSYFSDVFMCSRSVVRNAHACVLSTRSRHCYLALQHMNEVRCITVPEFPHDIFDPIIRFVYTGVIDPRCILVNFMAFRSASLLLKLQGLNVAFSRAVETQVSVENAVDILEHAHEIADETLRGSILKFISSNMMKISKEKWKRLEVSNPTLYELTKDYCAKYLREKLGSGRES